MAGLFPPFESDGRRLVDGIALVPGDRFAALGQQRHDGLAHDRLEKRLLALEIQVQRALAHAGACGHVIEPRGGIALLDEKVQRRLDVLRALDSLTPRQRAVVVLRHFEERDEHDMLLDTYLHAIETAGPLLEAAE